MNRDTATILTYSQTCGLTAGGFFKKILTHRVIVACHIVEVRDIPVSEYTAVYNYTVYNRVLNVPISAAVV